MSLRSSLCFRLDFLTTLTLFFQVLDTFDTLLYELDVNSYLGHLKYTFLYKDQSSNENERFKSSLLFGA